jgi:hypothetical protein
VQVTSYFLSDFFFYRAGMRLVLGNPERLERIQNDAGLDFEFARQIVNSDFSHPLCFIPPTPATQR